MASKAAAGGNSRPPSARWECCVDSLVFTPYSDDISRTIEIAWKNEARRSVAFRHRAFQYIIDFDAMTQVNVSTMKARPVRRVPSSGALLSSRPVQWGRLTITSRGAAPPSSDKDVVWFPEDVSKALEQHLMARAAVMPLELKEAAIAVRTVAHGRFVGDYCGAPAAFVRRAATSAARPGAAHDSTQLLVDESFALTPPASSAVAPAGRRAPLPPLPHPSNREGPFYHNDLFADADAPFQDVEFMVYPKSRPAVGSPPSRETITFSIVDRGDAAQAYYASARGVSECQLFAQTTEFVPNISDNTKRESKLKIGDLNFRNKAFVVHDFLQPQECQYIIDYAKPKLAPLDAHFPQDYRKADRAMVASRAMANEIFLRLLPHFTRTEVGPGVIPMCFGHGGAWFPHSCNEAIKINRYETGGQFAVHRDGPWVPWEDMASIYTVLIYLNDDFSGGDTVFVDSPPPARSPEAPTALVRPEAGMALIFNHDAWHGGRPVLSGFKYILRTEVIFARARGLFTTADRYLYTSDTEYEEARRLYDESRAASAEGRTRDFVDLYQSVVAMQREAMLSNRNEAIGVARTRRLLPALPVEVLADVLNFLSDADVAPLTLVNHATYYTLYFSPTWHDRFVALQTRLVRVAASTRVSEQQQQQLLHTCSENLAAVDWFAEYTRLRNPQSMQPAVLIFGGSLTHLAHSFAAETSRVLESSSHVAVSDFSMLFSWGANTAHATRDVDRVTSGKAIMVCGREQYQQRWRMVQLRNWCYPLRGIEPYHMCMLDADRYGFTDHLLSSSGGAPVVETIHVGCSRSTAASAGPAVASVEWCLLARLVSGILELKTSPLVIVINPAWYFFDGPAHTAVGREAWRLGRHGPRPLGGAPPAFDGFMALPSAENVAAVEPSLARLESFLGPARRDLFAATNTPAIATVNPALCCALGHGSAEDAVVLTFAEYSIADRGSNSPSQPVHYTVCYVSTVTNGVASLPRAHFGVREQGEAVQEAPPLDSWPRGTPLCNVMSGATMMRCFPTLFSDPAWDALGHNTRILCCLLDVAHEAVTGCFDDEDGGGSDSSDGAIDPSDRLNRKDYYGGLANDAYGRDDMEEGEDSAEGSSDSDAAKDAAGDDEDVKKPLGRQQSKAGTRAATPEDVKLAVKSYVPLPKRPFAARMFRMPFGERTAYVPCAPTGLVILLGNLRSKFGNAVADFDGFALARGASLLVATPGFKSSEWMMYRPGWRNAVGRNAQQH